MMPHDPEIAAPHDEPIRPGEGGKDDFPVTYRRSVRAWLAVAAMVLACTAVVVYWWLVVAGDDDTPPDTGVPATTTAPL